MATDVELGRIAAAGRARPIASQPGRVLNWRRVLALSVNVVAWGLIISGASWVLHRGR